ncbi:MAG: ArsR family transcriptional regulator, partial [Lysobacterales bacterium 13-68-4]
LDAFTTRPEVSHIETSLIFSFRRNPDLPVYRDADES